MEVDVAVDGGISTSRSALQINGNDESYDRDEKAARACRKRKDPAALTSSSLKSILRRNRSDLSTAAITWNIRGSSCGQTMRKKRSVNFNLEGRSNAGSQWSGRRLRSLALDLDGRDFLTHQSLHQQQHHHHSHHLHHNQQQQQPPPHPHPLPNRHHLRHHRHHHHPYHERFTNKQKSRYTLHPTFDTGFEDIAVLGSDGGGGGGIQPDDTPSPAQMLLELEGKDKSSPWKYVYCDCKDSYEQLMEKSYYISRWIQETKKETIKTGLPLASDSATVTTTAITTTTATTTSDNTNTTKNDSKTALQVPMVSSATSCVTSASAVTVTAHGSFPVGLSPSSLSLFAQREDPATSLEPLRPVSGVPREAVVVGGDDRRCSSDSSGLPARPAFVVTNSDGGCQDPTATPSVLNLSTTFNSMSIEMSSCFRQN